MFKFTRSGIVYLVMITTFILIEILIHQYKIESEIGQEIMNIKQVPDIDTTEKTSIWQIEIPKISLIANIAEGTTKETLKQFIGHFKNTQKEEGNIGLAAYNRGHEVNYFKDLKKLQKGDEIIYTHNKFVKIYEVEKCKIIKDINVEYLENTEENMLTLITYIENEPKYRRCVQAIEKEEEIY